MGQSSKLENCSAETNSSFTSQESRKYTSSKAPTTPNTLPPTPSGTETSAKGGNSGYIIRFKTNTHSGYQSKSLFQQPSSIANSRRDSFNLTSDFDDVADIPMRSHHIGTADDMDQYEKVISTEDEIISIHSSNEEEPKLVPPNGQILRMLEESQNEILSSMEQQETAEAIKVERTPTFSKIPEHPALGNLEKYRSGLAGITERRVGTQEKQQDVNDGSDHSADKASVTDGLKSLWDETTKNIESMNKVLSSCGLDSFRAQKSDDDDIFDYQTGYENVDAPLKGSWLEVPEKHREDISILSNPREISSGQSYLDESHLVGVPILEKREIDFVSNEGGGIVQENVKSRYNRWL